MTYNVRPLSCDPKKLKGLSERLIVSHWENNYGGAVKRLNAITTQLAGLDFATAPVFLINGLKREELIATNSSRVIIMLDGDEAGGEAAPRIVARLARSLYVRIADVPSGSQPDALSSDEIHQLLKGI